MSEEMKLYYLKNIRLFEKLPEIIFFELSQLLRVKTMCRGEAICYDRGSMSMIYFVLKGKIKLTEGDDCGNELVKELLAEGELFGDLSLDGNPCDDEVAEALTSNTMVAYCSVNDFKKLMQSHPAIALNYAMKVNSKLRRLESRHADLVFRDTKSRLIRFIKNWASVDGNRIGDKIILNNYLTHSEIAAFISTSRQSVNVLLNELRDSGVLCYNRKRIELTDPIVWN